MIENNNAVIVDSNLLLLLILGHETKIVNHPRINKYDYKHLNSLHSLFEKYGRIIVNPQILLETYHLLTKPSSNKEIPEDYLINLYKDFFNNFSAENAIIEKSVESKDVFNNDDIYYLGFTDISIIELVKLLKKAGDFNEFAVVSDDKQLIKKIKYEGVKTFSMNKYNAELYEF